MADVLVEKQSLINTANAIRTKTGSSALMTPEEMATNVASIPDPGRPTTWAQFAAMRTTDMQKVYGLGDRVGIACTFTYQGTTKDLLWKIANWGTTKVENDNTSYPCVVLISEIGLEMSYDAVEKVEATEETAQAGTSYYGNTASAPSTYTKISLSVGDTIPYSSYYKVFKSSFSSANDFSQVAYTGYGRWDVSNIRQWLNSEGAADSWFTPSHIGDAAPPYASQNGFLNTITPEFKAILRPVEVATCNYSTQTPTKSYDRIFIPSSYEVYYRATPVEGERMELFSTFYRGRGVAWRLRSNTQSTYINGTNNINANGSGNYSNNNANNAWLIIPCCKIILPG